MIGAMADPDADPDADLNSGKYEVTTIFVFTSCRFSRKYYPNRVFSKHFRGFERFFFEN